jgi:hypothetical protein
MSGWYTLTPAGPLTLGNLTPVGQNSGQVGCRWPPNGHHLAAALELPKTAQLWGPFWFYRGDLYLPMPQGVYTDAKNPLQPEQLSKGINLYRMRWDSGWCLQEAHLHTPTEVEQLGGRLLIKSQDFQQLWKAGSLKPAKLLKPLPWQTLTLSHNRRENYEVVQDGGFYAEMTVLLNPGWSILVNCLGNGAPPDRSSLGAGRTPVVIQALDPARTKNWDFLGAACAGADGAVLLTSALWSDATQKVSLPYPPGAEPMAYAAELGEPWQSWKYLASPKTGMPRSVLTPGEWSTPAGAIYRWAKQAPVQRSGPFPDRFNRHVLGYGHLWLFKETLL